MRLRPLLLALVLISVAVPALARDNSAAQHDLDVARRPTELFTGAQSFEFAAHLSARLGTTPADGVFLFKWKAKDQWWSKVVLGPFQQITIHDGEEKYTLRNTDFTPVPVSELFELIQLTPQPVYIAQKEKQKTVSGTLEKCIEAHRVDDYRIPHEFCVDAASGDLISDSWQEPMYQKRRREFSDYADFEGLRYPRKLRLFKNGDLTLSAEVDELQAAAFDSALLNPPKDAIARRDCPGIKPPVLIKQVSPDDDPFGVTGISTFSLTILTDGSVGDIRLIGTGGKAIDKSSLAALKQWKFKPAMCGSEPVVSDLEVSFGHRSF